MIFSKELKKRVEEALVAMFRRLMVTVMAAALLTVGAVPAFAAENPFKVILEDAVYGGLVGSLLGAASLAFVNNKSDHVDNIGYGAALGIMAGAGIGFYTNINRSFVEYENGKVKMAMPTVIPELLEGSNGRMILAFKADLVRGTF